MGGSAEMGHRARRGEEAVGGSGRWGYRIEDGAEETQEQGMGDRGTGRSRGTMNVGETTLDVHPAGCKIYRGNC